MIAELKPSISQIRFHVGEGLSAFETLRPEIAAEVAKNALKQLSEYLEAFDNADNAVSIVIVPGVKARIELENLVGNGQGGD